MRRLRLLWVTPHLPVRGVAAARERWWNLLARLAARHDISLLTFLEEGDVGLRDGLPPGLAAVHCLERAAWRPDDPLALLPRTVRSSYTHPSYRAALEERLAAHHYDAVQYEYLEMAALMPAPTIPTILTVHQLGFAASAPSWRARGGELAGGAIALYRHLRNLDWELRALGRAHHVITMSPEDAARLRRFLPDLAVSVSPVGVDCDHFRPPTPPPLPVADLLFVGNFLHPPNRDAVRFLAHEILPRLHPPVRVRIVGRNVTPDLAGLAREGVLEVIGAVADVRPHLAAARVVVVPVRFGTGMRGKLLEALALARPVVTTSVGAEGLGTRAGQHLLVADGVADFAAAVQRVLDDGGLAARLGAAGRALVETRFDWDTIAAAHEAIYEEVLHHPGQPPALPAERSAALARVARRVGGRTAVAAGAALLVLRGMRWHLRAARHRRTAHTAGAPIPLTRPLARGHAAHGRTEQPS